MAEPAHRPARDVDPFTLRRAQRGDAGALGEVVRALTPPVYSLVGRLCAGRRDLVDDVAQEAFLKIVGALPRFDVAGPARVSTWAVTIATRTAIDALRRTRRTVEPLDAEPAAADLGRAAEDRDLGRRVERAMAALPEDQRAVLVLRAYHDLDYDEIARALNVPEGTVKSRLGRARIALREAMGDRP